MTKGRFLTTVSLSLALGLALSATADAFGGHGGGGGGRAFGGHPSGFHQPGFKGGVNRSFPGFGGFGLNRSFPGLGGPGFGTFKHGFKNGFKGNPGVGWYAPWGSTTVYYGYDNGWPVDYPVSYAPVYATPPVYVTAPPVYVPQTSNSVAVAPPPPPLQSVVVFPGGRYELQGDGVTTPYQWVWIANPSSVPPVPPAPPTTPPSPPGGQLPPSASALPAPRSQLYRWTDDQGAVHWTNRAEAVPAKYRKEAMYTPGE